VTGIPIPPVVTVTISGEIDIATSRAMRDTLATGPGPAHLEVDMSAVTFMDASGIGVLLAARQRAVDSGGSLTLRAPNWAVRRLTGSWDWMRFSSAGDPPAAMTQVCARSMPGTPGVHRRPGAPAGTRAGDRAGRGVDIGSAPGRAQRSPDHLRLERRWDPMSAGC